MSSSRATAKRDITRKKAFIDSSDAGWNALLRVKPYLLDWITDVTARAKRRGKQLLAFSHYPAIDPFEDGTGSERTLFGDTTMAKRTPHPLVAETLAKAGVALHFSGHLHVEARSRLEFAGHNLVNIAVPSLVAFPAGFVTVRTTEGPPVVESVSLAGEPLDADLLSLYRAQSARAGQAPDPATNARDYGDFLYRHMRALVIQRYLPEEWPADMAALAWEMTLRDLSLLMSGGGEAATEERATQFGIDVRQMQTLPMLDLVVDWYCLRQSPAQTPDHVPSEKLDLYRFLAHEYGDTGAVDHDAPRGFFAIFLGVLGRSLERASRDL